MVEQYTNDKTLEMEEKSPVKYPGFGIRHLQMVCMFFTIVSLFIARSCMGVAVLAMSDDTRKNDTTVIIYDWDKKTQSLILSSFFWGYMVMQIPSGMLSKKIGGKPTLLAALLINGCLCLVLPTLAAWGGWPCVCAARVAMGLSQSCLFSATQTLLGQWFPPNERTSYSGVIYGGVQVGTIIAMPLSGILSETSMGWKSIFYTMSALLFITSAVWYWFTASSPAEHRMISDEERTYIESALNNGNGSLKTMQTPWREILTSLPVYAILVTHFASAICFVLFFVDMPTFLEKGLNISLKNSAVLSALPYIGMWVGNVGSTVIAENLLRKNILSLGACRKLFNSLAVLGITGGLVALSFLGPDNKTLAITAIAVTLTMSGFYSAGFIVNGLDLSPNFAGVILSFTNFVANLGSVALPIVTSIILRNDSSDVSRWRIVFLLTAGLSVGGNLFYLMFASFKTQPWNNASYFERTDGDPEQEKPMINEPEEEKKSNKEV